MINQTGTERILNGLLGLVEIGHTDITQTDSQKTGHVLLKTSLANQNKDIYVGLGLYEVGGARVYPTIDGTNFIEPGQVTGSTDIPIIYAGQSTFNLGVTAPDASRFAKVFYGSGSSWTEIPASYITYNKPVITIAAGFHTFAVGEYMRYTYTADEYKRQLLIDRASTPDIPVNTITTRKLSNVAQNTITNTDKIEFPIAHTNWGKIGYVGLFNSQTGGAPFMWAPIIYYNNGTKQNWVVVDGSTNATIPLFPIGRFKISLNTNSYGGISISQNGRPANPNTYTTYIWKSEGDTVWTESTWSGSLWTDLGEIEITLPGV